MEDNSLKTVKKETSAPLADLAASIPAETVSADAVKTIPNVPEHVVRPGTMQALPIDHNGVVKQKEAPIYDYQIPQGDYTPIMAGAEAPQYDTGIVSQYRYGDKVVITDELREIRKMKINDVKKRDSIKIVCRFINHEMKGGSTTFVYRRFKDQPIMKYEFRDGGVYEVTVGVMEHINNTCRYREHEYCEDYSDANNNIYGMTSGGKRPKGVYVKPPSFNMVTTPRYEMIPVNINSVPRM